MSKHVAEWLNAYLDGELNSSQQSRVEAHLAACPDCQTELESLDRLSALLQEVPVPEFTAPERFTAQVNLRLPHSQKVISGRRVIEVGWWMVPVGLLAAWVFVSTSFLVNDILSAANNIGLMVNASDWMIFGSSNASYWSATLGQFGVLSGNGLDWAASTEAFARISLPQITLQVSMALLYLSWMAIWWARRRRHHRQQYGQLIEG